MNSRSQLNIFLLLLLIGLISFFTLDEDTSEPVSRLTSLKANDITRITIPRKDRTDIVISKISTTQNNNDKERHNKYSVEWRMQQPYSIKAHEFRVNTLLKLSQALTENNYSAENLNLADYGLDTPRARIIFNDTEIRFGKSNPLNNKRYLLCNNKLSLVADESYPLVSAEAATFVDLYLLDNKNIQSIETANWDISKDAENNWASTNNLSADQIQTLLENWKHAQAFAVHKYMKRKQLGNIIITIDSKTIIFDITDDDPWLILARPDMGIEYHLDNALKNILLGLPDA